LFQAYLTPLQKYCRKTAENQTNVNYFTFQIGICFGWQSIALASNPEEVVLRDYVGNLSQNF
jgi:hypothetical protein